ncbi:MAG: hypothetical protein V1866_04475 [archaeon]
MPEASKLGIVLATQNQESLPQQTVDEIVRYVSNFLEPKEFKGKDRTGPDLVNSLVWMQYTRTIDKTQISNGKTTSGLYSISVTLWKKGMLNKSPCVELELGTTTTFLDLKKSQKERLDIIVELSGNLIKQFNMVEMYRCLNTDYALTSVVGRTISDHLFGR